VCCNNNYNAFLFLYFYLSLKDITEFSVPGSCLVAGIFSVVARDQARVFVFVMLYDSMSCHALLYYMSLVCGIFDSSHDSILGNLIDDGYASHNYRSTTDSDFTVSTFCVLYYPVATRF
jgi:hypothetical protein